MPISFECTESIGHYVPKSRSAIHFEVMASLPGRRFRRGNPFEQTFEARHAFTQIIRIAAKIAQRRDDERCKPDPERRADGDDDGEITEIITNSALIY